MTNKKQKETKEEFCGICLAAPLVFAGAGGAAAGSKMDNKNKKIYIFIGISVVLFAAWLYWKNRNCSTCIAP